MKAKFIIFILAVILVSCNNKKKNSLDPSKPKTEQLNITILLDLSDRVIQPLQPTQDVRDIEVVNTIVEIFKSGMEEKGAFNSKDKIRILFTPTPNDASINNIATSLNVDLSKMDNQQKKVVFDNISTDFKNGLSEIYNLTLNSKNWIGSDIWRFFKYDANQICCSEGEDYRNILIIITDGYIFHAQSTDRQKNRTSYITPSFLQSEGFRNNAKWKEKFEKHDYGFINDGQTYENLDILILEINPMSSYKNDEDIIRAYLDKWFLEMKVKSWKIYSTDLPINTKGKIEGFFN